MRDKINVFYYPAEATANSTLKKAILFFDEIHFMDRPSFMFPGQYGTIGAPSPLRQFEASFRDEGVPLFVHGAPGGPIEGDFEELIATDVNDLRFLTRFQRGIKDSEAFRDMQIAHGDYGQAGTHENVAKKVTSVDLASSLSTYQTAMHLFVDSKVRHFDLSTQAGCAKNLIAEAVVCSAKINFALSISTKEGFFPLADAVPYRDLLGAKYARAMNNLEPVKLELPITDLSFGVFDELVDAERLEKMTFAEVIRYRKAAQTAREEFLEHLGAIQTKQAIIGSDCDYAAAIDRVVKTEILPAARSFKKKLQGIDESLYGALAKGAVGYIGSSAGVSLFGDLSWEKLIVLAGPAGAYIAKAAIDAILAKRAAKRECAISYILSLDK